MKPFSLGTENGYFAEVLYQRLKRRANVIEFDLIALKPKCASNNECMN